MTFVVIIQKSFFNSKSEYSKSRIAYGGETRGKRKSFRPLDRKRAIHLTMKSSYAKGVLSLLNHKLEVSEILHERAKKYGVTIHSFVNMGNHLHILLSFKSRELMQKFLRVVPGMIARLVTKAKRGNAFGKRFWDFLAHTRIITSRRDYTALMHYFDKNDVERDAGPGLRRGVELHDEITKLARQKNVSRDEIKLQMWRKKFGDVEIVSLHCDD